MLHSNALSRYNGGTVMNRSCLVYQILGSIIMGDEIQLALLNLVSDERAQVLKNLCDILEELNFDNHHFEIQQIFGLQDTMSDDALLVERINDALTVACWTCLGQCGIEVVDSPLTEYIPILTLVARWEHFVMPEVLYADIESAGSDIEAFAIAVETITGHPRDNVIETLEWINPNTIMMMRQKLATLSEGVDLPDESHVIKIKKIAKEVNSTITLAGVDDNKTIVSQLARDGVMPLTSFGQLLAMKLEEIDAIPIRRRGVELYLMYLYSGMKDKSFHDAITEYTEDLTECQQLIEVTNHLQVNGYQS